MSLRREINRTKNYKKKSNSFLLPMLETPLRHITKDINYLIDVAIIDKENPNIVLIFDNIDYEPLSMDIYRLTANSYYLDSNYDDDNKEVCLFFDVPGQFLGDFRLFLQGEYSKLSNSYKQLLTKTHGSNRMDTYNKVTGLPHVSMFDAIYPIQEKRDALAKALGLSDSKDIVEVLSPPIYEEEEYKTIQELKEVYGVKQ